MKDKTFIALASLFFLIFLTAIGAVTLNKPINNILRAKDVAPSPLKSFGVVFPQIATAGNEESGQQSTKVKVSIYIRGVDGSILSNRTVKLASDFIGVKITPSNTVTTNNIGQAEFFVSSIEPGTIKLTATEVASNTLVLNIPTVEFVK